MRFRLGLAAASAIVVSFSPTLFGLGFGEIDVKSALNQPLDAEIRLVGVKPSERDALEVALASPKTFAHFGVDRAAVMDSLRLELAPAGPGELRLLLTSPKPVREPFLTLLLEAQWSGRRALREYSLLLDPPVKPPVATAKPSRDRFRVASPAAAPGRAGAFSGTRRATRERSRTTRRAAVASAGSRSYGPVARRETVWDIAHAVRPNPNIHMNKMMLAIFRANPNHFEGNLNLVSRGATLQIPSEDEIRGISGSVANREVAAQHRAFADAAQARKNTRQGAPVDGSQDTASDDLTVANKTDRTNTAAAAGGFGASTGELRLEPADPSGAAAKGVGEANAGAGGTSASDATIAALGQTAAQASRSRQFEQADDPLGARSARPGAGIVEDSSESGASKQSSGYDPLGANDARPGAGIVSRDGNETSTTPTTASDPQRVAAADNPAPIAEDSPESGANQQSLGYDPLGANDARPGAGIVSHVGSETSTTPTTASDSLRVAGADNLAPEAVTGQTSEAGGDSASATQAISNVAESLDAAKEFIEAGADSLFPGADAMMTSDRILLVLLALLLMGSFVLARRRQRYTTIAEDYSDLPGTPAPQMLFTPAADNADSALDVVERLGTADSLIDDNLYSEAAEVLQAALVTYPDDRRLQLKLLEAYYAGGQNEAFVAQAARFFPDPNTADPDWRQVATWGAQLAPGEPMFAANAAAQDDSERASSEAGISQTEEAISDTSNAMAEPSAPESAHGDSVSDFDATGDAASQPAKADDLASLLGFEINDPNPSAPGDDRSTQQASEPTTKDIDDLAVGAGLDAGEPGLSVDTETQAAADESQSGDASEWSTAAHRDTPEADAKTADHESDLSAQDSGAVEPSQQEPGGAARFEEFDLSGLTLELDNGPDNGGQSAPETEAVGDRPDSDAYSDPELEPGLSLDSEPQSAAAPAADDAGADAIEPGQSDTLMAEAGSIVDSSSEETDSDAPMAQIALPESNLPEADTGSDDEGAGVKFELAQAYLEMGEPALAQALLEEVREQGNHRQREQAADLLARI